MQETEDILAGRTQAKRYTSARELFDDLDKEILPDGEIFCGGRRMLTLETTAQFRRDYRRVKKRGYKMALLAEVLDALLAEEPLLPKHRDHALTGR